MCSSTCSSLSSLAAAMGKARDWDCRSVIASWPTMADASRFTATDQTWARDSAWSCPWWNEVARGKQARRPRNRRRRSIATKPHKRLKLLFADDERSLQELMSLELPRMGHEVTVCPDG